jgi:ParB/RepB/Spo0J family partition protein
MKIVELPIDSIKHDKRIRQDLGEIEALAEVIQEKGLLQPITVAPNGRLMAGERRLLAHIHLGLSTIKAIVREPEDSTDAEEVELIENVARKDLTWQEEARLQFRIYTKRKSKSRKWSQEAQAKLTGRQQPEIHRLLSLGEALEMGDTELETVETKEQAWKIYKSLDEEAGRAALMEMLERSDRHKKLRTPEWAASAYRIGDALHELQELSEVAHFAEVDPPYGVDLDRRKSRNEDERKMATYQEWEDFTTKFLQTAELTYKALKPHSFAIFWYGMSWHSEIMSILKGVGFAIPDIPSIWTKGGSGQTASPDTTLGSCYEPFFLARKGQPKLAKPGRGNVFDYPALHPSVKKHPTEKPITLLEEIINICCFPGSTVLVPFLGSGVTLRAAYKLGHNGFGWDLSTTFRDAFLLSMSKPVEEDVE